MGILIFTNVDAAYSEFREIYPGIYVPVKTCYSGGIDSSESPAQSAK